MLPEHPCIPASPRSASINLQHASADLPVLGSRVRPERSNGSLFVQKDGVPVLGGLGSLDAGGNGGIYEEGGVYSDIMG